MAGPRKCPYFRCPLRADRRLCAARAASIAQNNRRWGPLRYRFEVRFPFATKPEYVQPDDGTRKRR